MDAEGRALGFHRLHLICLRCMAPATLCLMGGRASRPDIPQLAASVEREGRHTYAFWMPGLLFSMSFMARPG